jgi:hypothetical protein
MDPNNSNYFSGMPGSNNPAMPYMNRAIGETHRYYDPYTAYASNPEDFVNRIYGSFEDSPMYQRAREQGLKAHTAASAASGRINNPAYEDEMSGLASSLFTDQMRQYYQDVLGQQGIGLQAAGMASGDIGNLYNQAGGLAFQQDQQRKKNKNALWGSLINSAGTIGGAALGGPLGTALGGALSKGLTKWMGY